MDELITIVTRVEPYIDSLDQQVNLPMFARLFLTWVDDVEGTGTSGQYFYYHDVLDWATRTLRFSQDNGLEMTDDYNISNELTKLNDEIKSLWQVCDDLEIYGPALRSVKCNGQPTIHKIEDARELLDEPINRNLLSRKLRDLQCLYNVREELKRFEEKLIPFQRKVVERLYRPEGEISRRLMNQSFVE